MWGGDGERQGERGKACKLIRYGTVCYGVTKKKDNNACSGNCEMARR